MSKLTQYETRMVRFVRFAAKVMLHEIEAARLMDSELSVDNVVAYLEEVRDVDLAATRMLRIGKAIKA